MFYHPKVDCAFRIVMTRKPTGKRLLEALYFLFPCLSMGSFSHEASRPHAEAWGYTNYVRLRGLNVLQGFEPAQAGFVCVAAISIASCV